MSDDIFDDEMAPPGSAAGYDKLSDAYEELVRNRWAAFTDDELTTALAEIGEETSDWRRGGSGFREEITAELERRRTDA